MQPNEFQTLSKVNLLPRSILGVLTVYALLAFVGLDWFPVFIDEPGYMDPAVSLLLGQGFRSGAWYAQGYEGFWAGNVPLHQALLVPWMNLFGFSVTALRSINILYVVVGVALLQAAAGTLGILRTDRSRLWMTILILSSHAGAIWISLGRPDAICVLLAGLFALGLSLQHYGFRLATILFVGVAAPWAGVPLALVLGFVGIALLIAYRKRFFWEVICLAIGGVTGVATLLLMYRTQGVLEAFVQSLLPHSSLFSDSTSIVPPPVGGLKHRLGALTDYTFLCLCAASAAAWLCTLRKPGTRQWIIAGMVAIVGIPVLLAVSGVFPIYYAWFAMIPGIAAFLGLSERGFLDGWLRFLAIAALTGIPCLGSPRVWTTAMLYHGDEVNRKSEAFVSSVLKSDDVVFTQPQAWYGAKRSAARVYHGFRAPNLTKEEADAIQVVICSPPFFRAQRDILTGPWQEGPERLSVPNRNIHRLPFSKWYRDNPTIDLHVYRRQSN